METIKFKFLKRLDKHMQTMGFEAYGWTIFDFRLDNYRKNSLKLVFKFHSARCKRVPLSNQITHFTLTVYHLPN